MEAVQIIGVSKSPTSKVGKNDTNNKSFKNYRCRTAKGLKEHLKALESFCHKVGMQVNTRKTKVMIF